MIGEVGLAAVMAEEPGVCHNTNIQQIIDLQDTLLNNLYCDESNNEEFCMFASVSLLECPSMVEEEYILSAIGQGGIDSQYIENMYGYTDERGDYYMVAAAIGFIGEEGGSEFSLVGATGTNYGTTAELKVMNYHQAMKTVNRKEWQQAIRVEHGKMQKYNVFKVVHKKDVPKGKKLVDYAWAMKKKPSGIFKARLAARELFE